ncbi:MAG: type I 3-dehydroquinate dehydratase, partial [Bacteroidota bacterium]|nr:type I 3-dehydroquinate dehydratase [Bacteroidota bacterium]
MICTSIRGRNLEEIWALLQGGEIEMAEVRLDLCPLGVEEVTELFAATDLPLVATCRRVEDVEKTLAAIEAGAKFADVDLELPTAVRKQVRSACEEYGTALIVSCHDENETPAEAVLHSMMERCQEAGADIVKIVTLAQTAADAERVLGLYKDKPSRMRLIAFAMGEAGRASRLTCLRRGAPFTYAAVAAGEETAPGQWTTAEMWETVYSR